MQSIVNLQRCICTIHRYCKWHTHIWFQVCLEIYWYVNILGEWTMLYIYIWGHEDETHARLRRHHLSRCPCGYYWRVCLILHRCTHNDPTHQYTYICIDKIVLQFERVRKSKVCAGYEKCDRNRDRKWFETHPLGSGLGVHWQVNEQLTGGDEMLG